MLTMRHKLMFDDANAKWSAMALAAYSNPPTGRLLYPGQLLHDAIQMMPDSTGLQRRSRT